MAKKKHSPEEVVKILRDIEIELGREHTQDDACKKLGITLQTYYRWRKEFGGLKIDQARRLKELEMNLPAPWGGEVHLSALSMCH